MHVYSLHGNVIEVLTTPVEVVVIWFTGYLNDCISKRKC